MLPECLMRLIQPWGFVYRGEQLYFGDALCCVTNVRLSYLKPGWLIVVGGMRILELDVCSERQVYAYIPTALDTAYGYSIHHYKLDWAITKEEYDAIDRQKSQVT